MQSLRVHSGAQLGYYDSGPPVGDGQYSTLVIMHGHTFNAANFSRTLLRANHHGIRVVSVARRDYEGSTLFTDEELSQLRGTDKTFHLQFLRERGYEIARFLITLTDRHGLPPVNANGEGGICLMGWSLGISIMNAFVYFFSTYPKGLQDRLRKHLKSLVAYDPPQYVMGQGDPKGLTLPIWNERIPEGQRAAIFYDWASAYYSHPFFQAEGSTLDRRLSNLCEHEPMDDDKYRSTTFETFTASDRERNLDLAAGQRSDTSLLAMPHETMYEVSTGALLLSHPVYGLNALPGVRVHFLFGQASPWTTPYCNWVVEEYAVKWESEGRGNRIGHIVSLPGANHFLHWDDPDRFLSTFKEYFDGGICLVRNKPSQATGRSQRQSVMIGSDVDISPTRSSGIAY